MGKATRKRGQDVRFGSADNATKILDVPAALRFRPANSNEAARAGLRHDFQDVPQCAFERGDALASLIGAQTAVGHFPAPPSSEPVADIATPPIAHDVEIKAKPFHHRLLRSGVSLSIFLHAAIAFAVGYTTLSLPDDDALMEGETVIAMIVEGTAEADMIASGTTAPEEEKVEEIKTEPKPVEKAIEKPVEPEPKPDPVKQAEPVRDREPVVAADPLPAPEPVEETPQILTAPAEADAKIEKAPEPVVEKKPVPDEQPVKDPEPVQELEPDAPVTLPTADAAPIPEKRPERIKPETERPQPKKVAPKKRGNEGKSNASAKRGDLDAAKQGKARQKASRGNSDNGETGNAARNTYKGLVQKKLMRAKSRVRNPGAGSVSVSFTIQASGAISGLRIRRSSGDNAIDAAARKIVEKAAPFPRIPPEAGKNSWPMTVPITFR